jgi:hypothetical protein
LFGIRMGRGVSRRFPGSERRGVVVDWIGVTGRYIGSGWGVLVTTLGTDVE